MDVDACHVVARVLACGHEVAKRLVVAQVGYERAKARMPRSFHARVVVALLGHRGGARPAHEAGPAVHVAGPARAAEVQERLDLAVGPLLLRRAAGGQGVWRSERAEGPPAMPVSAEQLEGGDVGVALGGAEDLRLGARSR